MSSAEFLQARIDRTQALIIAYENAIEAIANGAQSYQISTGQTTEMVTKINVWRAEQTLQRLEARLDRLCARQGGSGLNARPGW